jgi:hypothetical protein
MLASVLQSISDANNQSDGICELVVTALGSSGQHYICWKTTSGEYRQRELTISKPFAGFKNRPADAMQIAMDCLLDYMIGSSRKTERPEILRRCK